MATLIAGNRTYGQSKIRLHLVGRRRNFVDAIVRHLFLLRLRLALEWAVHGLQCNIEQHAAAPLPLVCEPAGGDPEHRLRPNRSFLGRLENPKLPKE